MVDGEPGTLRLVQTAPPDLSICQECGRLVPPSNHPEFANWRVTKDDRGRARGMLCPDCQQRAGTEEEPAAAS